MHAEWGRIDAATADRLNAARAAGGRVIAVGTTSLRLLESAADEDGRIQPVRRRHRDLHHPRLSLPRDRRPDHQLPPAALDPVHAGLGADGAGARCRPPMPMRSPRATASTPTAMRACCCRASARCGVTGRLHKPHLCCSTDTWRAAVSPDLPQLAATSRPARGPPGRFSTGRDLTRNSIMKKISFAVRLSPSRCRASPRLAGQRHRPSLCRRQVGIHNLGVDEDDFAGTRGLDIDDSALIYGGYAGSISTSPGTPCIGAEAISTSATARSTSSSASPARVGYRTIDGSVLVAAAISGSTSIPALSASPSGRRVRGGWR